MHRPLTGLYEAMPVATLPTKPLCFIQEQNGTVGPDNACLGTCNRYLVIRHVQESSQTVVDYVPGPTNTTAPAAADTTCNCSDFAKSLTFVGSPLTSQMDGKTVARAGSYDLRDDGLVSVQLGQRGCRFVYERKTPELPLLNPPPAAGLSGGAIAGIAVAVIAVLGVVGGAVYYVRRRRR
ncbi:hypothetical protein HDU96_008599 [Phlyctochytrium bullatum]|nr:hypothetical protein HDU96_008599 [Phlyctochytrium bullatum]